jgi:acyl-CoA synthetase (AMP-forming)/AMP-acid ligase II
LIKNRVSDEGDEMMSDTITASCKETRLGDSTLTVYSSLQYNASKYGDRLAFQDEEKKYTWSQSSLLICNVASVLAKRGVGKNSSVLFWADRTIESIVLLHALLLLGCKIFITNQHVFERIDREQYHIDTSIGIHLKSKEDSLMKTWNGKDIFNEGSICNSDIMNGANFNLDTKAAFIILFTSGTLGDAKAIQLSQFSYLNNAVTFGNSLRIDASDKYCLVTPVYHCFGIINIISALIKGACIFIPIFTQYDRVLSSIARYQCTVLNTVPTFFFGLRKSANFSSEGVRSIHKGVVPAVIIVQSNSRI